MAEPNITIHTGTEVAKANGYVGNYKIILHQQPRGILPGFSDIQHAIDVCPVEVPDEFNFNLSKRKAIYRPYADCVPGGYAIDWENCTHCGECLKFSPYGEIQLDDEIHEIEIIGIKNI